MKVTLIAALAGVAASSPVTTPPSTASTSGTKIVPWVVPGNYATPEKLTVGETITFKCAGMDHNIWQVSKAGYDGCTATDATTSTFWGGCDDGETKVIPASALKEGTTYFICTEGGNDEAKINGEDEPRTGGHCLAGQKMEVIVSAAGASHPSAGGAHPTAHPTATSHEGHTMHAATTTMGAEPTLPMEVMYDLLGDFDF
eukprot:comp21655_c0_seq1/m.30446 comp21655_c0_seq1/g.30446  ORF comp21655_c0_seq1/g.30446 comp21655_c0_seq1/m.30446 type:complete len:200 (-) comp21655_c0_seq1:438-1037(-)